MLAVSDYGSELILAVITGQNTMPAVLYVALTTAALDPSWDGTDVHTYEPTDGAYTRQSIITSGLGWGPTAGGICANTQNLVWSHPGANWGYISNFAICDALTGGNMIFSGDLTNPNNVLAGSTVSLPAGIITLSVASLTDQGSDS